MPVVQRFGPSKSLCLLMMCVGIAMPLASARSLAGEPVTANAAADSAKMLADELARLDSADLKERIAAHRALFQNSSITLDQLTRALGRPELSSEQRSRLNDIAYARFHGSPRAAMGVSFLPNPAVERIVIDAPLSSWDSARVLRPGDALVAIDGNPILAQEDVRISVISHDPGDQVVLVFERDGVVMRSLVRLGNFADLEDTRSAMGVDVYPRAWQLRLERTLGSGRSGERVVDTGVKAKDLARADRALRSALLMPPAELELEASKAGPGSIIMMSDPVGEAGEDRALVAGGSITELTRQAFASLDPMRHRNDGGRSGRRQNAAERIVINNGDLVNRLLARKNDRLEAIRAIEQRLADPKLNREERAEYRRLVEANQGQIRELDLQLRQLGEPKAPKAP